MKSTTKAMTSAFMGMALVMFIAGFTNAIHFLFSAMSAVMSLIIFFEGGGVETWKS